MALVKVYSALHNREGLNVFVWLGNSADLISIEEVWNIIKKKSGKLPNNKKKSFGIIFVAYGMVFIEKLLRNCMLKCLQWWKLCVRRKVGPPCTEMLKTMA